VALTYWSVDPEAEPVRRERSTRQPTAIEIHFWHEAAAANIRQTSAQPDDEASKFAGVVLKHP